MTYIKELIDLPERVHRGDFVLRLTEGVARPEETLRDYVVTPQLAMCFENALGFIRSALDSRTSKAAYLHGSFGSGKSHFMAVLHLLLQAEAGARSIPELASVVARHSPWMDGKRFLLVPHHLIGARNLESAIFGQYAGWTVPVLLFALVGIVQPQTELALQAVSSRPLQGEAAGAAAFLTTAGAAALTAGAACVAALAAAAAGAALAAAGAALTAAAAGAAGGGVWA